jgi:hypothetical protein
MPAGAGTMARAAAGVGRLAEAIDLSVVREARGSASREHRWSPGAVDQSAG